MNEVYITKRQPEVGSEKFDAVKLHSSILATCLAVRAYEGEAHMIAERVCKSILGWLATKTEVTSSDIRRKTAEYLQIYHPEAAYLYEHQGIMV
jgi:hypothetical protein